MNICFGRKLLVLGGCNGSALQRLGYQCKVKPIWGTGALIDAPEIIEQVYNNFISAGVDIIMTNTFRAQRRTFRTVGKEGFTGYATFRAIHIARAAANKSTRKIFVAGAMGPLEDCYRPDLVPSNEDLEVEHKEQANFLRSPGVDFILIETMNTIREARIATDAAFMTRKPVVVSFVVNEDGNLLSGESIERAYRAVSPFLAQGGIGLNCSRPEYITKAILRLKAIGVTPIAAYGNGDGKPSADGVGWEYGENHDLYFQEVEKWIQAGIQIIGGCCGTTTYHISKIKSRWGQA